MKKTGAEKMGNMPVGKLLLSLSLPMMISMLVQALYNVVDSIFVAKINQEALNAVSMAFPMQTLLIASATGTGVGLNALLSRSLGQKNRGLASKAAMNGLFLGLIAYVIFVIIGIFGVRPFYAMQMKFAPDASEQVIEYGMQYLQCVMICSFGMYTQMLFERLLISTGRTMYSMITQLTGAVVNIIFDPIMIFGYFGFPAMGIRGAAIATVFGQCVAAVLAIIFNFKKNHDIDIKFKGFRPEWQIIKTILSVGVPSIIMQAIGSVMTFGFNILLNMFSMAAVNVFGVYFKLNSMVFMPIFGLNSGMVPIIAYNFGAENRKRINKTIKYSVIFATSLMLIGLVVVQLIPDRLLMLFNADEAMINIGVPALRIICMSFIFAGAAIIFSSLFQALGHGIFSMFVSLVRQLIVLLPAAYILGMIGLKHGGDVNYVWWSFDIAEIISISVSLFFFRKLYKKVLEPLPEGDE